MYFRYFTIRGGNFILPNDTAYSLEINVWSRQYFHVHVHVLLFIYLFILFLGVGLCCVWFNWGPGHC